jgi:hypothetical protein
MNDAWASGSTHHRWNTCQVRVRYRSEGPILFVADVNKLDVAVSAESVAHRIESIPDNPVAAFDAYIREHFPQNIRNVSAHDSLLFLHGADRVTDLRIRSTPYTNTGFDSADALAFNPLCRVGNGIGAFAADCGPGTP